MWLNMHGGGTIHLMARFERRWRLIIPLLPHGGRRCRANFCLCDFHVDVSNLNAGFLFHSSDLISASVPSCATPLAVFPASERPDRILIPGELLLQVSRAFGDRAVGVNMADSLRSAGRRPSSSLHDSLLPLFGFAHTRQQ